MPNILKQKHGFSLIEIIIVMAIIGVVVTMIFSTQLFGMKVIDKGQNQYSSQYNIRRASEYINEELRYAETIEILSTIPSPLDPLKKYIYVDGGSIKHYIGGLTKDIVNDSGAAFTPSLIFNVSTDNDNLINFTIKGTYKGQNYNIASEVLPVNMKIADKVEGVVDGTAVSYGPFTNAEIVTIDKILFNLIDGNIDLILEADGSYTLMSDLSIANFIILPTTGLNGSTITWASSHPTVVQLDGTVNRPPAGSGDIVVTLTATIKKGIEQTTKVFTVKICEEAATP